MWVLTNIQWLFKLTAQTCLFVVTVTCRNSERWVVLGNNEIKPLQERPLHLQIGDYSHLRNNALICDRQLTIFGDAFSFTTHSVECRLHSSSGWNSSRWVGLPTAIGYESPNAYWTSRSASGPALFIDWSFKPPGGKDFRI